MNSPGKFRGAKRRGFSAIFKKPQGCGYPPPVGARVKIDMAVALVNYRRPQLTNNELK